MDESKIIDGLLGVAVGDALGVPVEFKSRYELDSNPVIDMRSYGTYAQPAGTWSDDSSLTFCLVDALKGGFDLDRIAKNFVRWRYEAYWTAHDELFDIGNTTSEAIGALKAGVSPERAGPTDENANGNGSLMRILPLAFYLHAKETPIEERFEINKQVSAITHGHIRAAIACFIYTEYALLLLQGMEKLQAYKKMRTEVRAFLQSQYISESEMVHFQRVLDQDIQDLKRDDIESSGYVMHSLEAAFWTLLRNNDYKRTVLEAVNLGHDTDTTAAIVGGLAGLVYSYQSIPAMWKKQLARYDDIILLAKQLAKSLEA